MESSTTDSLQDNSMDVLLEHHTHLVSDDEISELRGGEVIVENDVTVDEGESFVLDSGQVWVWSVINSY